MEFANIPIFNVMKSKMDYLSQRQGVLAQNVASADVPAYKAKDVAEPDFKKMAFSYGQTKAQELQGGAGLATTNEKHISASSGYSGSYKVITRDSTYELNPSGNNVSIEEEMAKISDNQAEYQKVLNLYRKTIDLFKIAIGKQSG